MLILLSGMAAMIAVAATTPTQPPDTSIALYHDTRSVPTIKLSDAKAVCTPQFNTKEEALKIWEGTGASGQLDNFIKSRGEKGWFDKMSAFALNVGGGMDCTSLTGSGNCEIAGGKCYDLVKSGKGQFYWILKAVTIWHHTVDNLYTNFLQSSAISDGLRIQEINTDFDVTPDPNQSIPNVFFQIAAALTLGVAVAEITSVGVGGWPLLISGSLLETAQYHQPQKPTKGDPPDLGKIIGNYFDNVEGVLQDLLANVLGKGDSKKLPAKTLTETKRWRSKVTQFFAEGKFLIADVGTNMKPAIDLSKKYLRQSLAIADLAQQGWWVQIYDVATKDLCMEYQKGKKGTKTKGDSNVRWIEGQSRGYQCATIAKQKMPHDEWHFDGIKGVVKGGKRSWPKNVDQKKSDLLTGKYGANLTDIYKSSIDCERFGKNRQIDTESIASSSKSIPRCFFNMPVQRGQLQGVEGYYTWTNYNITTGKRIGA
ncbi:hypothetical protein F4779DRAFT_613594 [Xylariaceae sp. FL0662B]|nr:hypothetical protein F4779DRAFT_613594 [Xylariaceae sp. FL0662B]